MGPGAEPGGLAISKDGVYAATVSFDAPFCLCACVRLSTSLANCEARSRTSKLSDFASSTKAQVFTTTASASSWSCVITNPARCRSPRMTSPTKTSS